MPAGQEAQVEEPGLETTPKNPAAQTVQVAGEVLPVKASVVVTPVGQSVQELEPAAAA